MTSLKIYDLSDPVDWVQSLRGGDGQALTLEAFNKLLDLAAEGAKMKPIAWLHTMDNTEGIPENEPYQLLSFSPNSPFGRPGVDYSESFPVTSQSLYLKV